MLKNSIQMTVEQRNCIIIVLAALLIPLLAQDELTLKACPNN